jgi:asparagine synthetase B (glutamine-hydrolysing)
MNANMAAPHGDFTVFGFARDPEFLEHKLPERLGIVPRTIDFGAAGTFFFYSSSGDIAETEESVVLKLGFVRSLTMSPFSAQQLAKKAIGPGAIDHQAFRGNALVAGFSKREPRFLCFKTILSAPQLYYARSDSEILCATGLRPLITMLDRVEMNQDAVIPLLLYGAVTGRATFFRNVYRLFPGELISWKDGEMSVDLVRDLRFSEGDLVFEDASSQSLDMVYERFRGLVGAYLEDIEKSDASFANLLSGGVDSSLLQLAINEARPNSRGQSFSYVIQVPSFEREVKYASQAATLFDTKHTFVNIGERDFPRLLIEATSALAHPLLTSAEVCKFGFAQSLSKMADIPRFLFVGQGADTLFGLNVAKKVWILDFLSRVPMSRAGLVLMGALIKPVARRGQTLLRLADLLAHWEDYDYSAAPINTEATMGDFTLVRRAFGDEAVRRALEDRRNREVAYLNSNNYLEKVHIVELLSDCYEIEAQSSQLFLAYQREQLYPFLDEDIVRLSLGFRPQVRYIKDLRVKHILKRIVEQRAATSITRQPKGGSMFHRDLHRWMQSGSLHEMVREISLPGSLSRADFDKLVENPILPQALIIWHLLSFDVFQKQVLQAGTVSK